MAQEYSEYNPYTDDTPETKEKVDPKEIAKEEKKMFRKLKEKKSHVEEDKYTAEELKSREGMIAIILKYSTDDLCSDATKKLNHDFSKTGLKKYSTEKLKEILAETRDAVSGQSLSNVIETGYYGIISGAEGITQKIPYLKERYNISGLSECIKSDPQISLALRQISIENHSLSHMSPEQRLLLGTTFAVVKTVALNRMLAQRDKAQEEHLKRVDQVRMDTQQQEEAELAALLAKVASEKAQHSEEQKQG